MTDEIKNMIEEYIKLNTIPLLISIDKNIFKNYTEIKYVFINRY